MVKPIYKYTELHVPNGDKGCEGRRAFVIVAEDTPHPNSSSACGHWTTTIVYYHEPTEIFETMDSIYVPA